MRANVTLTLNTGLLLNLHGQKSVMPYFLHTEYTVLLGACRQPYILNLIKVNKIIIPLKGIVYASPMTQK